MYLVSLALFLTLLPSKIEAAAAMKQQSKHAFCPSDGNIVHSQRLLRPPSIKIERDVLTKDECERLVQSTPEGAFRSTRSGYRYFSQLATDQKLLQNIFGSSDNSCGFLETVPISRVVETSRPHQDRFNDESDLETLGTIVDEEVILLYLNDNPEAFFHYGQEKIPLTCGTKISFHGGYPHYTEVNSGATKFLGPVTISSCSAVEGCYVGECNAGVTDSNDDTCSCASCDAALPDPPSADGCCANGEAAGSCVLTMDFLDDPSLCGSSGGGAGDPHIKKWNGEFYDYHGECDLVVVSSPRFGSGGIGLDVHIRTKIVDNWSFISSAAVKIGNDVLEVTNRGRYWVNGEKRAPTPTTLSGYHMSYKPATNEKNDRWHVFTIDLGNGQHVVIKSFHFQQMLAIDVHGVSHEDFDASGGLMGSFANSGALVARNGTTIMTDKDANQFGQEWQVKDNDPKLFQWQRAPQWPEQCILPDTSAAQKPFPDGEEATMFRGRRRLSEQVTHEQAEAACAGWGDADREFCIADVVATNDLELAKSGSYW